MSLRFTIVAAICLAYACGGGLRATAAPSPVHRPAAVEAFPPGDLESALRRSPRLAPIVDQAQAYRLQVLVSVPALGGNGWLKREGFRVDAEYFYPASAIKLCTAVAALEAVTELRESGADGGQVGTAELDTRAVFVSESTSRRRSGATTIPMLVQGSLIMSDNDASNDLFDLAGFDGLHERMWRMGLSTVRMRHRLGAPAGDDARSTPRVALLGGGETPLSASVVIPAREGTLALGKNDENGVRVGEAHFSAGRLVDEPMSFEDKNRISLVDLQDLLVAVMRPDLRPTEERPHLGTLERSALIESLRTLPSSRGLTIAVDVEHKPLLSGIERVVPRTSLNLASKGGRAFGFIVENAHVLDTRTGRSFFLTAALYTNANGRLNDDRYEYKGLAFPFLADLGEVVARSALDDPS